MCMQVRARVRTLTFRGVGSLFPAISPPSLRTLRLTPVLLQLPLPLALVSIAGEAGPPPWHAKAFLRSEPQRGRRR